MFELLPEMDEVDDVVVLAIFTIVTSVLLDLLSAFMDYLPRLFHYTEATIVVPSEIITLMYSFESRMVTLKKLIASATATRAARATCSAGPSCISIQSIDKSSSVPCLRIGS